MRMLIAASRKLNGMAVARPIAVQIRAMLISSAICDGCTFSPVPMRPNAAIMPSTVPNRPSSGPLLIVVAIQLVRYSRSPSTSCCSSSVDQLPQRLVADVAVDDRHVGQLRQGPRVILAHFGSGVVLAGLQLRHQLVEKLGLLRAGWRS